MTRAVALYHLRPQFVHFKILPLLKETNMLTVSVMNTIANGYFKWSYNLTPNK